MKNFRPPLSVSMLAGCALLLVGVYAINDGAQPIIAAPVVTTGAVKLPPSALKEKARLDSVFTEIAAKYPHDISNQVNTNIPQMNKFSFGPIAPGAGSAAQTLKIPIPPEVIRVWDLFDGFAVYGKGMNAPGIDVAMHSPTKGESHFHVWAESDESLGSQSKNGKVDSDNPEGHYLTVKGDLTVDHLELRSRYGVSQKFDDNPWSTLGADLPVMPVTLGVDATKYRALDGRSELERDKFWRIAGNYNLHPDALIANKYALERGFTPGRMIQKFSTLAEYGFQGQKLVEDSDNPGQADLSIFDAKPDLAERAELDAIYGEDFWYTNCFDNWPPYMSLQNTKVKNDRGTPKDYAKAAKLASAFIGGEKQVRGKTARYWEVKNESSISSEWVLHSEPNVDSWGELAKFHNVMADTIEGAHPDVKVGGPTSAWMFLENKDFDLARKQMKFMDDTKDHLSFYSHHFYEGSDLILNSGPSYSSGYLSGRLEGALDLLRTHGAQTGNQKPFLISEYGSLYGGGGDLEQWVNIKNYNGYLLRWMNKADFIAQTNAFILPLIHWNKESDHGLFKYDANGKPVVNNKLHLYLDFWKDYRGRRLPQANLSSDNATIPMHSVVEGDVIRIAAQNLNPFRVQADINLNVGGTKIEKIEQTRLYFDQGKIVYETKPVKSLKDLPMAVEETTMITVTLDRAPRPGTQLDERVNFADKVLQSSDVAAIFNIKAPTDNLAGGRLRICAQRTGGLTEPVTLKVNGKVIGQPLTFAREKKQGSYWGWVEVEVPASVLRANNAIELSTPQKGGTFTSVILTSAQLVPADDTAKAG